MEQLLVLDKAPEAMDFGEFVAWSQEASRVIPQLARRCETRIGRAFASIRPSIEIPSGYPKVHRCDLARRWCELRGVPMVYEKSALVCDGVRHALGLVFELFAAEGRRVGLPSDVYPVYWQIAARAGLEAAGFPTFLLSGVSAVLQQADRQQVSVVVLPSPFKLQGRPWSEQDTEDALRWLRESAQRRLILDGVYSFGLPIDPSVRRLIETDQVLYLDSLSKGWLHELVFGVAVVPKQDRSRYAPVFQQLAPSQENRCRAAHLLSRHARFPSTLVEHIDALRTAMIRELQFAGVRVLPAAQGYLVGVHAGVTDLLRTQGVLALPAAVFGSDSRDWSIASALPAGDLP